MSEYITYPIPATLNSYPVIMAQKHQNCMTVMVHRPDNDMPFVVATWMPNAGQGWHWGHYSLTRADADQDFRDLAVRNEGR